MMTIGDVLNHKHRNNKRPTIGTKDIVKGDLVMLRNGWEAVIMDNKKNAATRTAKVYGYYTEIGSIYTTDIMARINEQTETVVLTPKQEKQLAERKKFEQSIFGG